MLTYHLLDVFTEVIFGGNPLAVFPHGDGLPTERMQQIARELNLSETVFIQSPSDEQHADFRLRIFTPAVELPMAGHPTIGTAYLLHHLGMTAGRDRLRLEEGVGVIEVALAADGAVVMRQPLPTFGSIFEDRAALAALLSLDETDLDESLPAQAVSTGVPFLLIPVVSLAAMRRIRLHGGVWERSIKPFEAPHVFAFTTETETPAAHVHARMFAPAMGIAEDPATGAASGPLGAYLLHYRVLPAGTPILCEQGYEMQRPSQIHIHIDHDGEHFSQVSIGGRSVYVGRGELHL